MAVLTMAVLTMAVLTWLYLQYYGYTCYGYTYYGAPSKKKTSQTRSTVSMGSVLAKMPTNLVGVRVRVQGQG